MTAIQLNRGFVAIVDDNDEERVNEYNWNVQRAGRTHYACTVIGRNIVYMVPGEP